MAIVILTFKQRQLLLSPLLSSWKAVIIMPINLNDWLIDKYVAMVCSGGEQHGRVSSASRPSAGSRVLRRVVHRHRRDDHRRHRCHLRRAQLTGHQLSLHVRRPVLQPPHHLQQLWHLLLELQRSLRRLLLLLLAPGRARLICPLILCWISANLVAYTDWSVTCFLLLQSWLAAPLLLYISSVDLLAAVDHDN